MAEWDWNGIKDVAKNVLSAYVSTSPYTSDAFYKAEEAKRQKNLDAWNELVRNEELKRLQRQNETVNLTPESAQQFKDTMYEPFIWSPAETKTQSTQDYLTNVGVMNPGGVNLTGEITTQKPESLKDTPLYKSDYLAMATDIKNQKAAKDAADLKALLEQQKLDAQSGKDEESRRRWEEEQRLRREQLGVSWFNATKNQDLTKKDPLLIGYKDLAGASADTTAKQKLSKQYSSAIRSNINDPEKVQQYIERYNFLNETGYTLDNWRSQAQKQYNPGTNMPLIAGKKGNNNQPNQTANSNNKTGTLPTPQVLNDAQSLADQMGGVDKAIVLLKQQGARGNDPLLVALNQIKKNKKS
jgi:hypothetical protein